MISCGWMAPAQFCHPLARINARDDTRDNCVSLTYVIFARVVKRVISFFTRLLSRDPSN